MYTITGFYGYSSHKNALSTINKKLSAIRWLDSEGFGWGAWANLIHDNNAENLEKISDVRRFMYEGGEEHWTREGLRKVGN